MISKVQQILILLGPDSDIPLPRPCYQINQTDFGTDVAAMAGMITRKADYKHALQ